MQLHYQLVWVNGDGLGCIVSLIDAHQSICQLKHVVPQTDDDKLSILGPLLHTTKNTSNENLRQVLGQARLEG